jgi:hypothetical protein
VDTVFRENCRVYVKLDSVSTQRFPSSVINSLKLVFNFEITIKILLQWMWVYSFVVYKYIHTKVLAKLMPTLTLLLAQIWLCVIIAHCLFRKSYFRKPWVGFSFLCVCSLPNPPRGQVHLGSYVFLTPRRYVGMRLGGKGHMTPNFTNFQSKGKLFQVFLKQRNRHRVT